MHVQGACSAPGGPRPFSPSGRAAERHPDAFEAGVSGRAAGQASSTDSSRSLRNPTCVSGVLGCRLWSQACQALRSGVHAAGTRREGLGVLVLTCPLCLCLGWYRGYTLRKKSKKVSPAPGAPHEPPRGGTRLSLLGVCEFSSHVSTSESQQRVGRDAGRPAAFGSQPHAHVDPAARFRERGAGRGASPFTDGGASPCSGGILLPVHARAV